MRKELRLTEPNNGRHVLSYLTDILLTGVTSVILYYLLLVLFFNPIGHYKDYADKKNEIETQYQLNLDSDESYDVYESVIKDFYFTYYSDEIVNSYKESGYDFTIEHIYNIEVLGLPMNPTSSSYSTELYRYKTDTDGKIIVDEIALRIDGSGNTYYKNLKDLFYNSYDDLKDYLSLFDSKYYEVTYKVEKQKMINRFISFGISIFVYYILIPCLSKYGSTLMEKTQKLGYVNNKNGYLMSKWKNLIKAIIIWVIPFLGLIKFTNYSIILLMLLPLFINCVLIIFTNNHGQIADKILGLCCVDTEDSLIFGSKEEEENYHNMEIKDQDFIEKLQNSKSIDIKNIGGEDNTK